MTSSDASDLALYRAKWEQRVPAELTDLVGPCTGVVALPGHVVWSGLREFDLGQPRQRMGLYRTVLAEGLHDDLCRFLNRELLLEQWPVLRKLVSRTIRDVWESAFPELRDAAGAAA
ncbi:transcriptional regulator [Streptomyces sp. YC504]|uniref:Transcriptional regulator n=1 Tax=Streptomyces mesophilus TaxID=1775132 RepID=A0A6G4XCE4_9ACTN|nr:transcriptional regulator [Streptomyces mesophilus]NGO75205.1 transcriptional regulator [Streptomyces mesophilus]